MNNIPYIIKQNSITLYLLGKMEAVDSSHINFAKIKEALIKKEYDKIPELVSIPKAISAFTNGKATIVDGELFFNGKPTHNALAKRILKLKEDGWPFDNMLRFMENLQENPSPASVDQLFAFLEHNGLPITDDGHFLAYKAVKSNFRDKHTGKIDNSVGKIVTMKREDVAADANIECHYGLHCGVMDYVKSFGSKGDGDRIIVVKVHPRDAVSVPNDCSRQKLRCCRYEVIHELENYNTDAIFKTEIAMARKATNEPKFVDSTTDAEQKDETPKPVYSDNYNLGYALALQTIGDGAGAFNWTPDVTWPEDYRAGYDTAFNTYYQNNLGKTFKELQNYLEGWLIASTAVNPTLQYALDNTTPLSPTNVALQILVTSFGGDTFVHEAISELKKRQI